MELTVKGVQVTFTLRISMFITDMLEAHAITNTYKLAKCNMSY